MIAFQEGSPRAGDGSATLRETCGRVDVARSETGHNTAVHSIVGLPLKKHWRSQWHPMIEL
jgi:hypothetical protein